MYVVLALARAHGASGAGTSSWHAMGSITHGTVGRVVEGEVCNIDYGIACGSLFVLSDVWLRVGRRVILL